MSDDKIKNLYQAFINEGYDMEPEADFRKNLSDPKKRKAAYDALVSEGYEMEPFDEFETNIGYPKQKVAETPQQPEQAPAMEVAAAPAPAATAPTQTTVKAPKAPSFKAPELKETVAKTDAVQDTKPEIVTPKKMDGNIAQGETQQHPDGQDSIIRLRRGGEDYDVLWSEVMSKGGLAGMDNNAGAPLRVYMRDPHGKLYHVAASSVDSRKAQGWSIDAKPYTGNYKPSDEEKEKFTNKMQMQFAANNAINEDANKRVGQMIAQRRDYQGKGGIGQTLSEIAYNPTTGNYEKQYTTPLGTKTFDYNKAEQETAAYNGALNKQQEEQRVIGDAVNTAWEAAKQAETDYKNADHGILYDGPVYDNSAEEHKKLFDLEKMATSIYDSLPEDYRKQHLEDYTAYFAEHPELMEEDETAENAAQKALQGDVYSMVFQKAVEENMPTSTTDFLMKKIKDSNSLSLLGRGLSASEARARAIALNSYGQQHKFFDVAGTVIGMALDPLTYVSGGVGNVAARGAMTFIGKQMLKGVGKEAAMRYAAGTMTGRLIGQVAGGAANMATFEGLGNIREQLQHGGVMNADGTASGYSATDVLKSSMHGVLMGAAIGGVSNAIGNVADKVVSSATTTGGKIGARVGETAISTMAEGTIFGSPEMIKILAMPDDEFKENYEGKNKGEAVMDVWTDNMATMLGFKAGHAVQQLATAPSVLAEMKAKSKATKGRVDFAEQIRNRMDEAIRQKNGFTPEELDELRTNGYGDLADLFSYKKKTAQFEGEKTEQEAESGRIGQSTGQEVFGVKRIGEGGSAELNEGGTLKFNQEEIDGYDRMIDLMQNDNISEAARARAYYIVTGHGLPMSTITGHSIETDGNGNIYVNAMSVNGIVTRRKFTDADSANREVSKIMRQAEINSLDVGEKYAETKADNEAMKMACTDVGKNYGITEQQAYQIFTEVMKGNSQDSKDKEIAGAVALAIGAHQEDVKSMRPDAIRAAINEEYGVDVDKIIKAGRDNRSEEHEKAVDAYFRALFPEQKLIQQPEDATKGGDEGTATPPSGGAPEDTTPSDGTIKEEESEETTRARDAYKSYSKGENNGWGMSNVAAAYHDSLEKLKELFDGDETAVAKAINAPSLLLSKPDLTREQGDAIRAVIDASTAVNAIIDEYNKDVQTKQQETAEHVAKATHRETGFVQSATLKEGDAPVFVVAGNVSMMEDGSMVDTSASDESVTVYDPATKETKLVKSKDILFVGANEDPETVLNSSNEAIANNGTMEILKEFGDKLPSEYVTNEAEATPAAEEETPVPQAEAPTEQQPEQNYVKGSGILQTNDGSQAFAHVTGETREEDGVTKYEVYTNKPINGNHSKLSYFTKEELDTLLSDYRPEEQKPEEAAPVDDAVAVDEGGEKAPKSVSELTENVQTEGENVPNSAENVQSGENSVHETPVSVQETEDGTPSAYSSIPKGEKGEPIYEQAEPGTAWDAIVESAEGDEELANEFVADIVREKEGDLKDAENTLKKIQNSKGDKNLSMTQRMAAMKQQKKAIDDAQVNVESRRAILEQWKKIADTKKRREAEARRAADEAARKANEERKAAEAAARAAQEEAERVEREKLNGVPDWNKDTPADSRARGFRRVGTELIERPAAITDGVVGKEVEVKFSKKDMPKGNVVVVNAEQLQPSHIQGKLNPLHFIPEAQPKNRTDGDSRMSSAKIAENIRPEEITSSITAYTGAPTINARGEAIQGNSRIDALRLMWEKYPESAAKYKQYLLDHAEEFGIDRAAVEKMERPVLANMIDVDDPTAIQLGQFVSQDTESGGVERIKAKNVVQKLGHNIGVFAKKLLEGDADESFAQLVDKNGVDMIKWLNLNGHITATQAQSAIDSKGNLTGEAANDLKGILYHSIFQGGNQRLEEYFNNMPAKAQKAILATAFRDYDSDKTQRINTELQQSIIAFNALNGIKEFREAKNMTEVDRAVNDWKRSYSLNELTGESYLPSEEFSNFALALASLYKGQTQSYIQSVFNEIYDIVQGAKKEDLFATEEDKTPKSIVEAIKQVLNIDYNGEERNRILDSSVPTGQEGQRGGEGENPSGERNPQGGEPTEPRGGADGNSEQVEPAGTSTDNQGNPIDSNGNLIVESVNSVDKITDKDFNVPYRTVQLPSLPQAVSDALGADGRVPIIKKNIFDKNLKSHKDLSPDDSRLILQGALYNPSLYGQNQKTTRPYNWILVHLADRNSAVIVEVNNPDKKHMEIVNWHYIGGEELERKKRQAIKEGGLILTLPEDNAAADTLNSLSASKDTDAQSEKQENEDKKVSDAKEADEKPLADVGYEKAMQLSEELGVVPEEMEKLPQTQLEDLIEKKVKENGDYKAAYIYMELKLFDEIMAGADEEGISVDDITISDLKWDDNKVTTIITTPFGRAKFTYDAVEEKVTDVEKLEAQAPAETEHADNVKQSPLEETANKIAEAEQQVNTNPTEAQKEAGNYKKGHVKVGPFDVTIENSQGSERSGVDKDGNPWKITMQNSYGYFRGTEGVDGDHIDVFLSNDIKSWNEKNAYVVDQYNEDGSFDEHKVMLGFNDENEARKAYLSNYSKDWADKRKIVVTTSPMDDFQKWIESSHHKTKAFAEYAINKKAQAEPSYTITPSTYTNKKGKTSDVFHLDPGRELSDEEYKALQSFVHDKPEGSHIARGWRDRESGVWVFRSENDAKEAAKMLSDKEALADNQPLSLSDLEPIVKSVGIEGVFNDLYTKGTTKLSDHAKPVDEPKGEQPKEEPKAEQPHKSKWVDDEDAEEFAKLRDILRKGLGQLNMGFPPELLYAGGKMSYLIMKHGARKIGEFAKAMIEELGEAIRPHIKSLYSYVRYTSEVQDSPWRDELSSHEEVDRFDIANFDKPHTDAMATAEMVVKGEESQKHLDEAVKKIKEERNDIRKEKQDEKTTADTEAIASQSATIADEAESGIEAIKDEETGNKVIEKIDKQLDAINEQLALLGYYEAEENEKDYNEAYGYMRNAEKKATKDAEQLGQRLAGDLGIDLSDFTEKKGKKTAPKKLAVANIAPIGGDITITLPLAEGRELKMFINLDGTDKKYEDTVEHGGENLQVTGVMYRVDNPDGSSDRYGSNMWANVNVTYDDLLKDIQRHVYKYLPERETETESNDYKPGDKVQYSPDGGKTWKDAKYVQFDNGMHRIDTGLAPALWVNASDEQIRRAPEAKKEQKTEKQDVKVAKTKKKEVSSQQSIFDLFSQVEPNNKEDESNRTGEAENNSGESGQMGRVLSDGDGVLDTDRPSGNDRGETSEGSGEQSGVAPQVQGVLPGRRSGGSSEGRDNGGVEKPAASSDGRRGVRTGDAENGGDGDTRPSEGSEGDKAAQPIVRVSTKPATAKPADKPKPQRKFLNNYRYGEDATSIDNFTATQRLDANIAALDVVRTILTKNRPATPEEREVLGRFRGWGGVDIMRYYNTQQLRNSYQPRLMKLADIIDDLDPDGKKGIMAAIRTAAQTSYYTPTSIARVMNDFVATAGFKGGNMLDPSMGSGVFEGTMSQDVQQRTMINGVELDWLTGQVAKGLYPDANIQITGYQDASLQKGAYDVVISNVPFGSIAVNDPSWKNDSSPVKKAAQSRIHNYFAVKMLESTKPGGLCVIMTTSAMLDTPGNKLFRSHIAEQAEILGAVRLPGNIFKGAGTEAVSDVIFLRKYRDEDDRLTTRTEDYINKIEKPILADAVKIEAKSKIDGNPKSVRISSYFSDNRDMMLGEPQAGGQYSADQFGLVSNEPTEDIAKKMADIVNKKIIGKRKGQIFDTHISERQVREAVSESYKGDGDYISNGNIVEQNGKLGIVAATKNKYGEVTRTFNENPQLAKNADKVRAMIPVRTAMKRLIAEQINGATDKSLEKMRGELKAAYDNFVSKYGQLNDKKNDFISNDIDGYAIRSLEKVKDGKVVGLSDIFTKNTIKPRLDITKANNPSSAIALSLAEYGEIRESFMQKTLGDNWAEQCEGSIFKVPNTDRYEVADGYLSGDVKTKLEEAREAAKVNKEYERNVEALEKVQPENIAIDDISIHMGARWIPDTVYSQFMREMFGIHMYDKKSGVAYYPEGDIYTVNVDSRELGGLAERWATARRSAAEVFEAALQNKDLKVYDTVKTDFGEEKVINIKETEAVNDKIQELRDAFEDWLPSDPERIDELGRIYNDKFNRSVLRKFDGSHLNVPGLMGKELRPHQKDAVWMLINNRGGIVDHIVGAGKTLVMQSAIMEMRRMGIAKKPMIVALKATCGQIAKEFTEAFPAAHVLAPSEKDFSAMNRKKFLGNIAVNDYDCIILSHEQYCMLPHTEEVETQVINEQLEQLDQIIGYLYGQGSRDQLTKRQLKALEKRRGNLQVKLQKMLDRKVDREFTFENLGVDYLFVDECQAFKSLPYVTSYQNIAGLSDASGSQRAVALLNGVRYLQKLHQGDKGTVFLSGTTITNSLVEIYNIFQYLRPQEMQRLGFTSFDAWASNFAVRSKELEYGVTNELKEKARFRNFDNVPELAKMYAEIADVRNDMNLQLPKPKPRTHIVTVPASDYLQEINREVVNMVHNKDGHYFGVESNDNTPWGLLASTISAKAAISTRLIDPTQEDEGGKVFYVCENVKKVYDQFKDQKGTQLIFCDTGIPGKGKEYDVYSDIINRLVNQYGIPREEIADIHVADTDEKRKALFAKVNDGKVRVLIGGTKNMGTGVNVQKRIVAMHHIDVPWTPADREQREGRGVRQGNEIAKLFNDNNVDIFFYATEGSLDMYKYQLQDTKGKMFASFKRGTVGDRNFDEGNAEESFDPAEIVALLSGNPVIFEKSKQDKKVEKLRRNKRNHESDYQRRLKKFEELKQSKVNVERLVAGNKRDIAILERSGFTPDENGVYPSNVKVSVKGEYTSKEFDKPKEAGEYIKSLIDSGKMVEFSGYGMRAYTVRGEAQSGLFASINVVLDAPSGIRYSVKLSDDATNAGLAYRSVLNKVLTNQKVYDIHLNDVNHQLEGADPGEYSYPKQQELDEAIAKKKELDEEYKKLSVSDDNKEETPKDETTEDLYRTSDEIEKDYPNWLEGTTNDNGKHSTQVEGTRKTYKKVGDWIEKNIGKDVAILDASSGMGYGTADLRERGFNIEDVEPYQSDERKKNNPATYDSYNKIDKKYDYIISNAVLNVIPDDWRANVLHNMADVLNDGGKMFINTRKAGEEKLIKDKIELDAPQEVLVKRNGKIASYQRFYTPSELKEWVEKELGDGYSVEVANEANSGTKGLAAVVVTKREDANREGDGAYSDEEVSYENDPIAKMLGQTTRTPKQQKAFAARERNYMRARVNSIAKTLNISDDVEIVTDTSTLEGKRAKAKGFFNKKTGKITIVIPNHSSTFDAEQTILHEAVAHYGLRKLFKEHFNDFLDNVFNNAEERIRRAIVELSKSHGWDFRTATEEYLARLAEKTNFNDRMAAWWEKIKTAFLDMLHKIGFKDFGHVTLTDNELRYILWRSYENMRDPDGHLSIFGEAADIAKRAELKVGDYAEPTKESDKAADVESDVYRDMDIDETITKSTIELAKRYSDNWDLKNDAIKAIGGNLTKLRRATATQRAFDEQTVKSVADLARTLIQNGMMSNLSGGEVKDLLSAVKSSISGGERNYNDKVKRVLDIMINSQLKGQIGAFEKILSIRGSKVNAQGIEVQGELDVNGQRTMQAFKNAIRLTADEQKDRMADVYDKLSSSDQVAADEAAIEYDALLLAEKYNNLVNDSIAEERALKQAMADADGDRRTGKLSADAYQQLYDSLDGQIRQTLIDRAEGYRAMTESLVNLLAGSVDAAKQFREAEKERVKEIQHNANSDLEGKDAAAGHVVTFTEQVANSDVATFFTQTLPSFAAMLRTFGRKSAKGEGYLYDRFMRGWVDAANNERTGKNETFGILNDKAAEMFGKGMKWSELAEKSRSMKLRDGRKSLTVTYTDAGVERTAELKPGNLMYIYMVNKMADGEMKLRKMGITEDQVEQITDLLPSKLIDLADWLQDEFFVQTREKYNEVHKRLFGASMAAVENYCPLKILSNSIDRKEDVGNLGRDDKKSAVTTGSIIKRVRNVKPIDILNADAFNVTTKHVSDMEHWAAFSEFSRDINTLLSYRTFANKVRNMTTIYGGGNRLFEGFKRTCAIATGDYRPDAGRIDKAAVNLAKLGTMAKVSFRPYTAFKQLASMPAYLPDTNTAYFAKNLAAPRTAFKWALENLPLFEKRWVGRMSGEEKLLPTDMDASFWRTKTVQTLSKYGMMPNAFFDAVTVAVGAKSMYETRMRQYINQGYDPDEADKKAKQDAAVLFNETQQSSEAAFVSSMQSERSWFSVMFTAFRNASIGYERKLVDAGRGIINKLTPGYKAESIAFMTKKHVRAGLNDDQAKKAAEEDYKRSWVHDLVQAATFGFILQATWYLVGHAPYLLLGNDDDEKKKMASDDLIHAAVGGTIEGLTAGDVISDGIAALINDGQLSSSSFTKNMPVAQDIENTVKEFGYDKVQALNDLINVVVESGVGLNPQTISDAVVATWDFCQQDATTASEVALLCARILQVPQSQLDKIYFDELDCNGMEARQLTPQQVAERYATYKVKRASALTGWLYSDEAETSRKQSFLKKAKTNLKAKLQSASDKEINDLYNQYAEELEPMKQSLSAVTKEKEEDIFKYAERLNELATQPDYRRYKTFKAYDNVLNRLAKRWLAAKNVEEKKQYEKQMADTKRRMVEALSEISE